MTKKEGSDFQYETPHVSTNKAKIRKSKGESTKPSARKVLTK